MTEETEKPRIVSALPSRPLTVQEGEALAEQESESSWVRPESILLGPDGEIVVALGAVDRDRGQMYLIGFDPGAQGWTVIDRWNEAELGHDSFYECLDEWEEETFADREEYQMG